MERHEKNTLSFALCGIGLIVLLGGVFGLYNFLYGMLGAFILWIIGGTMGKTMMGIIGAVGFIMILVGVFHFALVYVLLGAISIWVIAGALTRYYKIA